MAVEKAVEIFAVIERDSNHVELLIKTPKPSTWIAIGQIIVPGCRLRGVRFVNLFDGHCRSVATKAARDDS